MNITISIFMALPHHGKVRRLPLCLKEDAQVADALVGFQVHDDWVWLYVINHRHVVDRYHRLSEGDHLMVFPPMEGG